MAKTEGGKKRRTFPLIPAGMAVRCGSTTGPHPISLVTAAARGNTFAQPPQVQWGGCAPFWDNCREKGRRLVMAKVSEDTLHWIKDALRRYEEEVDATLMRPKPRRPTSATQGILSDGWTMTSSQEAGFNGRLGE